MYTENHHIIPKSLGGLNSSTNLVILTAREHFVCHWLLTKMTQNKEKRSMIFALRMLKASSKNHKRYSTPITSRVYDNIKKIYSKYMSSTLKGRVVTDATKEKMSVSAKNRERHSFQGKSHSADSKKKIGDSNRGKTRTVEQKANISNSLRNMSQDRRDKLSKYKKEHPLSEELLNKIRKCYLVTYPNGYTEIINNITKFCEEHGLSLPAMRDQVAKGKQEHHKGFIIKPEPRS
jgi:hypothetical protein